ncbi:MAG: hypothetical protein OK456_00705 [Thaumarchaeota archaeon]|nr:hypothetical protein [Nitrososphaerota archaeon]
MALISGDAFFSFLFEVLLVIGVAYLLLRVYRDRTRKVRKLR